MIAVLDYGIGNLASAQKALVAAGAEARLVTSADEADDAAAVVLPGVGAFGACMDALRSSGLDVAVHRAVDRGAPFLGVCVGLQMLYEGSDESPGVAGLGIVPGVVRRLVGGLDGDGRMLRVPQMQWNRLDVLGDRGSPLLDGLERDAWCYFVHSYAAPMSDDVVATCDYGEPVTAVIRRGPLWATQFHPEKSGDVGLHLLRNFVKAAS